MKVASPISSGPETPSPPVAQPSDRRGRRRAERRSQVYAAALQLFIERGYEKTTIDDIAERADVARATVFNHYPSKVSFVHEWTARRRKLAIDAVIAEQLDDHSVGEILLRYLTELARISQDSREETVALMGIAVRSTNMMSLPALGQELAKYIARARQRGEVRATIDPDEAGLILASGYLAVLAHWIAEEPTPFDLAERLVSMLNIQLGGIIVRQATALP